jgi:hypothetical protein
LVSLAFFFNIQDLLRIGKQYNDSIEQRLHGYVSENQQYFKEAKYMLNKKKCEISEILFIVIGNLFHNHKLKFLTMDNLSSSNHLRYELIQTLA